MGHTGQTIAADGRQGAQLSRAVGIQPQPEQVADEMAIPGLAYTFADAVNRRDAPAFEAIWDDHGVWVAAQCGR